MSKSVCWQIVSDEKRATKPAKFVAKRRPALYFSQQISSTSFCCATSWLHEVEKAKHRPKTWNETMSHGKLRVFVSRISPPLLRVDSRSVFISDTPVVWVFYPFTIVLNHSLYLNFINCRTAWRVLNSHHPIKLWWVFVTSAWRSEHPLR